MRLSVVVLTRNEAENIGACLQALARQTVHDFEVIVIDAGSRDGTCAIVEAAQQQFPVPLHLEAVPYRIPIGDARNLGVELARTPCVAFLSADADPHPDWARRAIDALDEHGMVFGRQVHAPRHWTPAAAVRGLRYHFPSHGSQDALRYASNVCAAYHKQLLQAFPFDAEANASEDILLARRASAAGHRAVYDPDMIVYHHDVHALEEEMRKNLREGYANGQHADELGASLMVLGWGAVLAGTALLAWRRPRLTWLVAGVLWTPALRRAVQHRHDMAIRHIALGSLASPVYDLAFLIQYIRGIVTPRKENPP